MPHRPTPLTDDLRDLIRILRTDVAQLSQRQAALAAGFSSSSWWRQIESGAVDTVAADTVARMVYSLDGTPEQLRAIGEDHVADLVERRRDLLAPETADDAEDETEPYLMKTPGLTEAECVAVVAYVRTLRQIRSA